MIALPRIVDVRHLQATRAPRTRVRRGRTVQRDPSTVTGVTLHQTAVSYGITGRLLQQAHGDPDLARGMRSLRIPAHAVAFRSGAVTLPHPLRSYTYHAHGLNGPTLGLEIEGVYPGLRDDPETPRREDLISLWGDSDRRTPWTLQAKLSASLGLVWLVTQGRAAGMPIRDLWAHRQSRGKKRSDPGEEIYAALLPLARELGLTPRWADTVGDGRPVPRQWIAESTARY